MTVRMRAAVSAVVSALVIGGLVAAAAPAHAATPWVVIAKIYYNSPGNDTGSNTSLNAEYVTLKNTTSSPRTVTGWTIRDKAGVVYTFPATTIKPKSTVTLRTGEGSNGISTRYWQQSWYVWNNTGDTAYLRNTSGTLVDHCTYTSTGTAVSTAC